MTRRGAARRGGARFSSRLGGGGGGSLFGVFVAGESSFRLRPCRPPRPRPPPPPPSDRISKTKRGSRPLRGSFLGPQGDPVRWSSSSYTQVNYWRFRIDIILIFGKHSRILACLAEDHVPKTWRPFILLSVYEPLTRLSFLSLSGWFYLSHFSNVCK